MAKGPGSKRAPQSNSESESESESDYTSSSEDVSEDEFGEDLTPALDAAILQTLGRIKRKEGVYGGENVLQEALKEAEKKADSLGVAKLQKTVAEKPYLLADYHREALLRNSGKVEEDEEEEEAPLTNVQQQRRLRQDAISAFKSLAEGSDNEGEGNGDDDAAGLLVKRETLGEDEERDAEEYRKFLLEMGGGEDEVRKILGMGDQPAWEADDEEETKESGEAGSAKKERKRKSKKSVLSEVEREEARKQKESADDDFLMNYILNRGWIDRSEEHVPTYSEIVGNKGKGQGDDDEEGAGAGSSHPWGVLEGEDEFDEKAEEFETAYNFRYEEPGAQFITTHPRNIETLVRRTDDSRKTKREARKERKEAERAAKEEETRRLKGKKRREMEAQIAALKRELGDNLDWGSLEKVLDGDFDEDEWERVVGTILTAAAEGQDEGKPRWDDLEDAEYDEPEEKEEAEGGVGEAFYGDAKDEDFGVQDDEDEGPINMDADFIGLDEPKKKKRKDKKSKGKDVDAEAEPGLTAAERAEKVKRAMTEYKQLDHEDMIGDMPTRFKYTKSAAVDFGLSPVEILLATDAELNALAGVKHLAPYRRGGLGKTGMGLGKRIRELKSQLRSRKWDDPSLFEAKKGRNRKSQEGSGSGANSGGVLGKRKWGVDDKEESQEKKEGREAKGETAGGKKKRLGKKQRMRAKAAEGAGGGQVENLNKSGGQEAGLTVAVGEGEGGKDGEKKRRKKRKSGANEV